MASESWPTALRVSERARQRTTASSGHLTEAHPTLLLLLLLLLLLHQASLRAHRSR